MREIVLDTETTGIDATTHRIVEIGCLELINGVKSGQFFHTYLNPDCDISAEAERIHGLSAAFLRDKPLFAERVDEFLAFIADSNLVIHNAAFDMRFINAELERVGFAAIPMQRAVDTLAMVKQKFPGAPASLDALCKRFNVDASQRTKHGALLDAELLAEVYIELLGGKQVMLAFDAGGLEKTGEHVASSPNATLAPREFPVSEEEIEEHTRMLGKLKAPLWENV